MNWAADDEVIPHTEIRADFVRGGEDHTLEAVLVKEQAANGGEVEAVFRRQLLLNGVPRRAVGVVGRLNVVLFLPRISSWSPAGPASGAATWTPPSARSMPSTCAPCRAITGS
jgi:hypothetical protein